MPSNKGISWRDISVVAVGGVAGAVATMFIGSLDYFNKDRELDIRMVGVALTILSGEKDKEKEKSLPARRWAIDLLDKYSGVKIKDREKWIEEGVLPSGKFLYDEILSGKYDSRDWSKEVTSKALRDAKRLKDGEKK